MRYVFIFLAVFLTSSQAFARPLTPAEYSSLNAVVEKYTADILAKNFDGVTEVAPHKIFDHLSSIIGKSTDEARKMVVEQTVELMEPVTIKSFQVNLTGLNMTDAQNKDGSSVSFTIIPYSMEMILGGRAYSESTILLALYETNHWWLVRFDPEQTELLLAIYPFLKNVEF